MRFTVGLLATGVLMLAASYSDAQFGFSSSNSKPSRLSPANVTGNIGPTSYLGSTFRLRDLFPSSRSTFSNRNPVGYSVIPDPSKPEYFKAFGYKKLF